MGREIVGDDMNRATGRLVGHNLREKSNKLSTGMAGRGLAQNLTGARLQGSIERKGAVAMVFKPMSLGSPWRERQHRVQAIQRLNGCLFIHTEDRSVGRRFKIEADDVTRLGLKVRVVAGHVAAQTMRLQPGACPDPRDPVVAQPKFSSQFARTPVGRAIARSAPGVLKNPSLYFRRILGRRPTFMPRIETTDALLQKAPLPAHNIVLAALQRLHNLAVGVACRQLENELRSLNIIAAPTPRSHPTFEFQALRRSHCNSVCSHSLVYHTLLTLSMIQCTSALPYVNYIEHAAETKINFSANRQRHARAASLCLRSRLRAWRRGQGRY